MQTQPPPDPAARLLAALQGLDLTSADGRAGIGSLLSEIERLAPGAVLQQAARIELRALGWTAVNACHEKSIGRGKVAVSVDPRP